MSPLNTILPTNHLGISIDTWFDQKNQPELSVDCDSVVQFLQSLSAGNNCDKVLQSFLVDERLAKSAAAFLSGHDNGQKIDCVKALAILFANNYLPSEAIRSSVLSTFSSPPGTDLVDFLRKNSNSYGVKAFLENLDNMERQEGRKPE